MFLRKGILKNNLKCMSQEIGRAVYAKHSFCKSSECSEPSGTFCSVASNRRDSPPNTHEFQMLFFIVTSKTRLSDPKIFEGRLELFYCCHERKYQVLFPEKRRRPRYRARKLQVFAIWYSPVRLFKAISLSPFPLRHHIFQYDSLVFCVRKLKRR